MARDVCQGWTRREAQPGGEVLRSRGAPARPGSGSAEASSTAPAIVPAAPPTCTGQHQRGDVVVRVQHAGQPAGSLQAERGGYGVLGERPGDHGRRAVFLDQAGEAADLVDERGAHVRRSRRGRRASARCRPRPGWSGRDAATAPPRGRCPRAARGARRPVASRGCRRSRPPGPAARAGLTSPGCRAAPSALEGATPADTSAASQAPSTSTIALSNAASEKRSPARSSPGQSRSAMAVSVADR